jgi:hypothetical protein
MTHAGTASRPDPNGLPHTFNAPTSVQHGPPSDYLAGREGHHAEVGSRPSQHPENLRVASKNDKRYGRGGSKGDFPYSSTGEQPGYVHESPVPPSLPVRHVGGLGKIQARTVGWPGDGKPFIDPEHPNSSRKLHTGAVHTHPSLKSEGLMHDASGGAHGRKSVPPKSDTTRGATKRDYPRGTFSSEPQRRGKSTGFNR